MSDVETQELEEVEKEPVKKTTAKKTTEKPEEVKEPEEAEEAEEVKEVKEPEKTKEQLVAEARALIENSQAIEDAKRIVREHEEEQSRLEKELAYEKMMDERKKQVDVAHDITDVGIASLEKALDELVKAEASFRSLEAHITANPKAFRNISRLIVVRNKIAEKYPNKTDRGTLVNQLNAQLKHMRHKIKNLI